jgi:hypothetical integral membrane protein (TIGR02206 family)
MCCRFTNSSRYDQIVAEPSRFVPYSAEHWVALVSTAIAAGALSWLARRGPDGRAGRAVRFGLAGVLLAGTLAYLLSEARVRTLTPWDFAPLHLCDLAIFLGVVALITRWQTGYEILYFWAGAGTLLAMLTPDVWYGFPHWRCLAYFGLHSGVIVAALSLTFGFGMRPRPGAPWRVFLVTAAYAGLVGLVNWAFRTNFLYLRHKPSTPTLLDALGPWPFYIVVAALLGLGLFLLLELPFRLSRGRGRIRSSAGG